MFKKMEKEFKKNHQNKYIIKISKKKSSHPQKNVAETGEDLSLYSFADLTNWVVADTVYSIKKSEVIWGNKDHGRELIKNFSMQ